MTRARHVPSWKIVCDDCGSEESGGAADSDLAVADDELLKDLANAYRGDYDRMRAHASSRGHTVRFHRCESWVLSGAVRNAVELDKRDERAEL